MMIKAKKDILSELICKPQIFTMVNQFKNKKLLRILAYHRIYNIDVDNYIFDEDLISATAEDFSDQLKFISKNFTVITFQDASNCLHENRDLPDNSLIITFDDGYADNYYNAFPLLKNHSLPAVFFLATDYIGTKRLFWFEKIAYWGKNGFLGETVRELDPSFKKILPVSYSPSDWPLLRSYLIQAPNHERLRLFNCLESHCNTEIPPGDINHVLPMTWAQVVEMSAAGMEIGSHTKSHLVLGMGSTDEIIDELNGSKKIIEDKISMPVRSVSYPIASHSFAINKTVLSSAEKAGYEWGVSYFSGADKTPTVNDCSSKYWLKRLKVERYTSLSRFSAQLLYPSIFAY